MIDGAWFGLAASSTTLRVCFAVTNLLPGAVLGRATNAYLRPFLRLLAFFAANLFRWPWPRVDRRKKRKETQRGISVGCRL
jgi:hypothetical protein